MDHPNDPWSAAPERFRAYLLLLARSWLGEQERARFGASDVVQQTMLEAHRKRDQFRGHSDAELAAWLRQMLTFCIADPLRAQGRARRDVGREQSLEAAVAASSSRLNLWLADEQSSPSQRAAREEELLRLAEALRQLPEDQRLAVERKHLHGASVAAIAREMRRSETAIGGLLRRGLTRLRELLHHEP